MASITQTTKWDGWGERELSESNTGGSFLNLTGTTDFSP